MNIDSHVPISSDKARSSYWSSGSGTTLPGTLEESPDQGWMAGTWENDPEQWNWVLDPDGWFQKIM